ncbi:MAG: PAS domain S-box protein [Bacteroidales bacterium]
MINFTERISQLQLLSENYEIVRKFINTIHESVIILDNEGKITDWNIVSEKFIGITKQKAIGSDFLEVLKNISHSIKRHTDIKKDIEDYIRKFTAEKDHLAKKYFNFPYRKPDGELIFVRTLFMEIVFSGKSFLLILSRVIENKPKTNGKTAQINKLLNQIFDNEAVGIAICSADGKFINANNKLLSMLEYNLDEITSLSTYDISYKDELENDSAILSEATQKGLKKYTIEKRLIKKNKEIIWVKINSILNWTPENELESVVCFIEDITLSRKVEEALKESEKKYRFIAEKASDIIYSISLDSRITFYNRVVEQIFDISVEELQRHNYDHFMSMADKDYANELHQERLKGVKSPIFRHKFITPSGKVVYLEFSVAPLFDDNNKVIGSLGIARDVTGKVIAEQELKQKNIELENIVKTKDKFLSVIAHDLKSPFNTLIGFSNVLLDNYNLLNDTDKQKYIQIINSSANSGYDLLKNLLDWSRSQSNQLKFMPRKIKIGNLINNSIQNLKHSAAIKDIELVFSETKEFYVETDEMMFNTVFRNLLTNAIKFSNVNSQIITSIEENKKSFIIHVRDFGIGLKEDEQISLFKNASVVSKEGTSHEPGTGLGLLICKEFLTVMGGTIYVNSNFGQGSTFSFTLPKNS